MSYASSNLSVAESISRLEWLCEIAPPLLLAIPENEFSKSPAPGKWSKKQIIGHLVDSASNNHQRFVRVQFEETPVIRYDQDEWNEASGYAAMNGTELIAFWSNYNKFLAKVLRQIPASKFSRTCNFGEKTLTLEFIIVDYVAHLEHHLKQIVSY